MSTVPQHAFSMGGILSQSLAIMKRNFIPFSILAILLSGLPQWIMQIVLIGDMQSNIQDGTFDPEAFSFTPFILSYVVALIFGFILYSALVYGTFQDLKGVPVSIGQNLSRALQVLIPVVVLSIIMSVAISIGFILLIVPGVILSLMWAVAIPVRVVEKTGIFEALSRSAALTKGERWRMLGLFLIFFLIAIVVSVVLGIIIGLVSMASFTVGALLNAIISSILAAFGAVLFTVLYAELRQAKDGVDATEIAKAFD